MRCEAFLKYRNLTSDQMDAARTYVEQRNWSGFGQQAYDTAKATVGTSAPDRVDKAMRKVLDQEFAEAAAAAVPGASTAIEASGPAVNGHSMACPTGQR